MNAYSLELIHYTLALSCAFMLGDGVIRLINWQSWYGLQRQILNVHSFDQRRHLPLKAVVFFYLIVWCVVSYLLQFAALAIWGRFIHLVWIAIMATGITWMCTRVMLHSIERVIRPYTITPQDNLIGRLGCIVAGQATPDVDAQALVRDEWGVLHQIRVCAEFGCLPANTSVILIDFSESNYIAKQITVQRSNLNYTVR